MIEEKTREEKIEEVKKEEKEDLDLQKVDELLKNNKFDFEYEGIQYRARKPTFKEKQEAYAKRLEKELELLETKDEKGKFKYKTEDQLKIIYKERGIDVDEFDNKFTVLEKRKNDFQMKLGKALKEKRPDNELEIYKKELEKIFREQQKINIKKTKLFSTSIENQIDLFTYTYLTYLVAEKLEKDKWVKVWNSWEEFENSTDELINQISFYTIIMLQREI